MTWKCVISVPTEYVIEFATTLEQAQAGAENIRAKFPTLERLGHTFYPWIMQISGPSDLIDAFEKKAAAELQERLKAKAPVQLELPLGDPPNDTPPAA